MPNIVDQINSYVNTRPKLPLFVFEKNIRKEWEIKINPDVSKLVDLPGDVLVDYVNVNDKIAILLAIGRDWKFFSEDNDYEISDNLEYSIFDELEIEEFLAKLVSRSSFDIRTIK